MIEIKQHVSLKPYHTFGTDCYARYFSEISSLDQVHELLSMAKEQCSPHLILGGGSNVLFRSNFDGFIFRNTIKGIEKIRETEDRITLRVGSGESWSDFVAHCVHQNWGGIENLSLIPGTIGAAPIQNIGAYGVEVKDVIDEVEFLHLPTDEMKVLTNAECHFGYRESIFKHELKENFFISSVTLTLTKKNHRINTSYGPLMNLFSSNNDAPITIQRVSDAVINVRREKLPDYRVMGNAGSFFKNPEITEEEAKTLQAKYPSMPQYPAANQRVKVPAAWLIESCGWKGKHEGGARVHVQQPLVIVNHDHATGDEIFSLAKKIIASVQEKFSITLTPEVNIF